MKEHMGRFVCIGLLALAGASFSIAQAPQDKKDTQDKQDTQETKPQHSTGDTGKERVDARVSGPWGRIQIEGVPGSALVFLNGTTPEFFVGHADEMNNHIFGEQALVVPVGPQEVHVLANKTEQEIWTGKVDVKENQRVVIYTKNPPGEQLVYKRWEGPEWSNLQRFEAGTASARIAVAPVKAKLAVDQTNVNCNDPVKVSWDSTDAVQATIKANNEPVASTP